MVSKLLEEKGDLPVAALTLRELKTILDDFKENLFKDAPVSSNEEELLSLNELVTELGVSKSTIYRLRMEGAIPEYMVGKRPKFKLREVRKAITSEIISPSSFEK